MQGQYLREIIAQLTLHDKKQAKLAELAAENKRTVEEVSQISEVLKKANEELAKAKEDIGEIAGELSKTKV